MNRLNLRVLVILLLIARTASAQETRLVGLKNLPAPVQLQHYRIVAITDSRYDTTSLGILQHGSILSRKKYAVNLQGGVIPSLKTFIAANFRQDTAAMPVSIGITNMRIKELSAGIWPEIEMQVSANFFIGELKVTQYNARMSVRTMGDQLKQVSELMTGNLQSILEAFDEWWNKNQNLYAPDAPVQMEVILNNTPDTSRLVNYSPRQPLAIADFRAHPDPKEKAVALTASSIIVKYSMIADTDRLKMMVVIIPYFDRSRSWFRRTKFDDVVLLHEQGHFDITAIIACELADTLRRCTFTKANCYQMVDQIQAKKKEEMKALQDLYDDKTGHGATPAEQEGWAQQLREMLARLHCYP